MEEKVMRNLIKTFSVLSALVLIGVFFSCSNPTVETAPPVVLPIVPGTLDLTVNEPSEAIGLTDTVVVTMEHPSYSTQIKTLTSWSSAVKFSSLVPGLWTVKVQGYDGGTTGTQLFSAQVTVDVKSGNSSLPVEPVMGTVSPVVFSPANGNVPVGQLIGLSSLTQDAEIYFTTNGNDPSKTSSLYSAPIALNTPGAVIIKARAYFGERSPSPVTQALFTVSASGVSAAPSITPDSGNYEESVQVTISSPDASIYYTTDGSTPSESSTPYSTPFTLTTEGTLTVKSVAKETGKALSAVVEKTYTISAEEIETVATPVIAPAGPTIQITTSISITTSTADATIYYTVDGSDPTSSATKTAYTNTFNLPLGSQTVKAYAIKTGATSSLVASKTYTVTDATTGILVHAYGFTKIHYWIVLPAGAYAQTTWPGVAMNATGGNWFSFSLPNATSTSLIFNTPIAGLGQPAQTIDLSRTTGEWWYKDGVWYDYDIDIPPVPVITSSPDTTLKYNTAQQITLTSTRSDDDIWYTTNGSTPTTSSTVYSGPFTLNSSSSPQTVKATGRNVLDQVGSVYSFTYDINSSYDLTAPGITASKAPGGYPSATTVRFTLTDNVGGITAYYTTNGTTPTTGSPIYATTAGANVQGAELNIAATTRLRFLVKDTAGNTYEKGFNYYIGQQPRGDFREETVYFLMTTRFYDGDTLNNIHCWDDAKAGNPDSDPAWRGDFKGLIQKLDYIKALGFSAVWVTPVVKNMSGYDYHGYHAVDHSEVDPRYLSADTDYQDLIDAVHARDMRIIQDIVLNHTGNFGEENLHSLFQSDANGNYLNWQSPDDLMANSFLEQGAAAMGGTYASLTPGNQFQARIKASRQPLDTAHHYHSWDFKGGWETYEVQIGSIAGDCQDLDTENPNVTEYLRDSYINFINMGVDSFRIDTVKHIARLVFNKEFIPQFKQAGGDNFFIFGEACVRRNGEIWNAGIPAISVPFYTWKETVNYPWSTTGNPAIDRPINGEINPSTSGSVCQQYLDNDDANGQPSSTNAFLNGNNYHTPDWSMRSGLDVIDFTMHWAFNSVGSAWGMALAEDPWINDSTFNVTYIDSHDYAPDQSPENQRYTGSWPEKLSLIFTFRGIPTIYYGSEIEFKKGAVIDVGPNAPLSATGRAYFGDHIEGSVTVSDFGKYSNATGAMATTLNHDLAKHIRALNLIRRAVPALQKGQYSTADVSGSMAFRRRFTGTMNDGRTVDSFALVALDGTATFTNVPNGTYRDVVTGQTHNVSGGSATLSAGGTGNLRVWVLIGGTNQEDPGHVLTGMFPLAYIK